MSDYPKKVEMKDVKDVIGKFIVLWRGEGDDACKVAVKVIDGWTEDSEVRISYEVMTGPDKGEDSNSRYDASQTIMVYDEDSLALAALET